MAADQNAACNQTNNQSHSEHHPAPMLSGMSEHADESTSIFACNEGDAEIANRAAKRDHDQKLGERVIGSACRREKHAGRSGERNGRRRYQSSSTPLLEELQKPGDFTFLKSLVEISRSSFAGKSESEIGADNRSGRGGGCILIPGITVTSRQYAGKNIEAAKSGQGRTVENREEEKPHRSKVEKR